MCFMPHWVLSFVSSAVSSNSDLAELQQRYDQMVVQMGAEKVTVCLLLNKGGSKLLYFATGF